MWKVLGILLVGSLAGACYQPSAELCCDPQTGNCPATCQDGSVTDGAGDGSSSADAPGDGAVCMGSDLMQVCVATPPTAAVNLASFNTDTVGAGACSFHRDLGGRQVCVVVGRTITIPAGQTATITGARPLVLASSDGITIVDGTVLDLSSTLARSAAGSQPSSCGAPTMGMGGQDGSGGASFAEQGGDGAIGAGGLSPGRAPAAEPVSFRGGCGGAVSPNGLPGGVGGGAVYLASNGVIRVEGKILATGSGGRGGASSEGGAGGGSGGYIGIDSTMLVLANTTRMLALGGGGGGGGCGASAGMDGASSSGASTSPVPGGAGADSNGNGDGGFGLPAFGGGAAGTPATGMGCGGGGGGGGAGTIQLFRTVNGCDATRCAPVAVVH